jgi:hypothetical protein
MRRKLLFAVLALAMLGALPVPTASAQTQAGDSVTGSYATILPTTGWTLDAHSGPSGEAPSGTISFLSVATGLTRITLPVTCLVVSGNQATVVGSDILAPGQVLTVTVWVEDNGTAENDRLGYSVTLQPPPSTCSITPSGFSLPFPDQSGPGITVVDAPPLPTSKNECQNGGWRAFGIFKNQGDCVSFVATKGKDGSSNPLLASLRDGRSVR